jgi:hypothetical protein
LHLGISVDQIAARQAGHLTRIDSLQLGVEGARMYGSCDTGYPCAYQYNISWASESLPLAPEPNPRVIFEKLFGGGNGAERAANLRQRLERRRSVLDFVLEDARSLNRELGRNDRQKLDEYLSGIRQIETQIEKAERFRLPEAAMAEPAGKPEDHTVHVDLMYDLMALAFQTDSTRVISFAGRAGGEQPSVSDTRHFRGLSLSHAPCGQPGQDREGREDRALVHGTICALLRQLDGMKEPDGTTVLDNSMIVYGCAIGDGNKHNHDELPVVVAGGGGGTLRTGRHVLLPQPMPMTNLYTALLDRMGVKAERVGDSTGRLEDV